MPYSYATFAQAKQQLANRLFDSSQQFWANAELGGYIVEALRTWNALTSAWRAEFTFPTQASRTWYDITDPAVAPATLRPLTVTDVDIYTQLEYHLLEPATGATWSGSSQFTIDDLLNAVQRKRDEILSLTECFMSQALVAATPGRTFLPDRTLNIRRIAWLPNAISGSPYTAFPLFQSDAWGLQAFEPGYTTAAHGQPQSYLQSTQPQLSFDVDVQPAVPGNYDILSVLAGAALSSAAPSTFSIPDDWTWVIKWGALADLLGRESNAKDIWRASYAEQRYQSGIKLLRDAAAVLALRLNNIPLELDAVHSADVYNPNWQAAAAATPGLALTAGLNLLALSPASNAGPYSVTASVVQNAPLPASDASFIQIDRASYDAMLDYAQHLAAFKQGGAEFINSRPLLQSFIAQAADSNSKLRELAEFQQPIYSQSQLEASLHPVRQPEDANA